MLLMRSDQRNIVCICLTHYHNQDCTITYCPVCKLEDSVRKIKIRGICSKSIFNNDYILTINSNGEAIYQGSFTSYIFFNKTSQLWNWYDHKENSSVAVRYSIVMNESLIKPSIVKQLSGVLHAARCAHI